MAQLPPSKDSADKVFTTDRTVIVLDGASSYRPQPVSSGTYAACLGQELERLLTLEPTADLRRVLAAGITAAVDRLDMEPGRSPSSTVTIVRAMAEDQLEILLLGDNLVMLPDGRTLMDDRMDRLDIPQRTAYRHRLASGAGYDEEHRAILHELQAQQARHRNRVGGYWIAETDPNAAEHALIACVSASSAMLATDGAYNTLDHLGLATWATFDRTTTAHLTRLLDQCQRWEAHSDPQGRQLPRAKRHDDKTLVLVRCDNSSRSRLPAAVAG